MNTPHSFIYPCSQDVRQVHQVGTHHNNQITGWTANKDWTWRHWHSLQVEWFAESSLIHPDDPFFLSEVHHAIWSVQCGTRCACGQDVRGHDRASIWNELGMRPAWFPSGTFIQMDDFTSFHCTTYVCRHHLRVSLTKLETIFGTNLLDMFYEFLVWSMTYLTSQKGWGLWAILKPATRGHQFGHDLLISVFYFSSIYTNVPSVTC